MTTTALGVGTAPLGTAPLGDGDVPETVGMTDGITIRVHHRHLRLTWGTWALLPWSRITAERVDFTLSGTNDDGSPAAIPGVQCALLPYRSRGPSAATVWEEADWIPSTADGSAGTGQIFIVGPDATSPGPGSLQLGDYSADVWARVASDPEVEPAFVARIDLLTD